jgi:hypothetical protein
MPTGVLNADIIVQLECGSLVPRVVAFPNLATARSGKDRSEMRVMIRSEYNANHYDILLTKEYHNGVSIETLVQHFVEMLREMGCFLPETEEAALGGMDFDLAYIPGELNNSNFQERFVAHLVGSSTGDGKPPKLKISASHDIHIKEVPLIQRFTLGLPDNKILTLTNDNGATARGPRIIEADGNSSVHRYLDADVPTVNKLVRITGECT